jgi:hypothetical protein
MAEQKTEKLFLRYDFTEAELKQISMDMGQAVQRKAEAEESQKAAVAQFKEQIARAASEMQTAARKIVSGYEMRYIDCNVVLDWPSVGMAQIVRKDTGHVVKIRAMTPDELQAQLDFGKTPAAEAPVTS